MKISWVEIAFALANPFDYKVFCAQCVESKITQHLSERDYIDRILRIQETMVATGEVSPSAAYLQNIGSQSKGLGDTVEKIMHKFGVDKLAKKYEELTGKPCGCQGRKDWLNEKFPYGGQN